MAAKHCLNGLDLQELDMLTRFHANNITKHPIMEKDIKDCKIEKDEGGIFIREERLKMGRGRGRGKPKKENDGLIGKYIKEVLGTAHHQTGFGLSNR